MPNTIRQKIEERKKKEQESAEAISGLKTRHTFLQLQNPLSIDVTRRAASQNISLLRELTTWFSPSYPPAASHDISLLCPIINIVVFSSNDCIGRDLLVH